jgi:hypothetical protein
LLYQRSATVRRPCPGGGEKVATCSKATTWKRTRETYPSRHPSRRPHPRRSPGYTLAAVLCPYWHLLENPNRVPKEKAPRCAARSLRAAVSQQGDCNYRQVTGGSRYCSRHVFAGYRRMGVVVEEWSGAEVWSSGAGRGKLARSARACSEIIKGTSNRGQPRSLTLAQ